MLRLSLFSVSLCLLAGCGPSLKPVTGSVQLDGKAVGGANVTFVSTDGKYTAEGTTDDAGNFTLSCTAGQGAFPGEYKVVVTKYPKVTGGVPGENDKSIIDQMKKEMDKGKTGSGTGTPMPKGMKGAPMMPPGMGGMSTSGVKSELPEVYSTSEKTPLTAKVPSEGAVQLQLKSK